MADPVVVEISDEWKWQKIATGVTSGSIHRLTTSVYYYQTYRLTGEDAPDDPTAGELPAEAVRIFDQGNQVPISSIDSIDVYILCANNDDDTTDVGSIRLDL